MAAARCINQLFSLAKVQRRRNSGVRTQLDDPQRLLGALPAFVESMSNSRSNSRNCKIGGRDCCSLP